MTVIQRLTAARADTCYAVVVSPTRELATQIAGVFTHFTERTGVSLETLIGGSDTSRVVSANILVGTPGRLEHSLGLIRLSTV